MSAKRARRKPRKDGERIVLPDEGKEFSALADGEQKAAVSTLDELALETQRRSIAYGRARGVA